MKKLFNLKIVVTFVVVALMALSCKEEHVPSPIPPPPPPKPKLVMNKTDSLAMVEIYTQMNGKVNLPGWDLKDWNTWGGVTASILESTNTLVVTGVNLNCDYNGILSDRVGDLEFLRLIALSGKGFYGNIPNSIANLKYITTIKIGNTNLTGLPDGLFNSEYIDYVIIAFNEFAGSLPSSLGKLGGRKISYLSLSNNKFSGAIPKLNSITKPSGDYRTLIVLDDNNFTEIPFEYITDPTLASVSARRNRFSGELPQNIVDAIEKNPEGYAAKYYFNIFWNEFQEGCGFTNAPKVNP